MTLALYGKSRRRQWALVALALFAIVVSVVGATLAQERAGAVDPPPDVPLNSSHVGATNPGFTIGSCPTPPQGQEGWYGWHFVMPANNNFTSLSVTFQNAGTFSANPFPGTVFIAHPDPSHAYIWTPGPDTLTGGTATSDGDNKFFNLSHVCPGSETPVGNLIVGKVIDPSSGVAPADGTTFGGSIVNDVSQASTPWSGITFGQFTSPIVVLAGVDHTVDEDSPTNGWAEVGWAAGSLDTQNNPVCPADKDSYSGHSNIGVKLLDGQTQVVCVMNTKTGEEPPTRTLEVCKHVESDSAVGGSFTITVSGQTDFVTGNLAPGDDECTTYDVADGAEITITETGKPAGWTDSSGYPNVSANGDNTPGNTITVTVGVETCDASEEEIPTGAATFALHSEAIADCTVVFYNKGEGQVESRGLILVEKYIEIDGNLATTLPGEGLVAGWTVTVDGVSKPTTLPSAVSFEAVVGDTVPVSEATPPGYNVLGHTVNGGALQAGSSTNILVTEATTLVRFYNQPLGSLTVNKVALTSHNNSPDVPSPQDRDGWTITVSSAACGINQSKQTDASGNATFTGLPKCTDYVVSENTSNPQSPNFVPVGASSVSNVTPNGQTITFTNRRATFDIVIITPTPVIPTPAPTFTPTNTPTSTPTNTPTATPTPEETQAGVRTPGPTPIAPSTGTGGGGGAASVNLLLLIAGFAVLSGGATLAAVGKRRR